MPPRQPWFQGDYSLRRLGPSDPHLSRYPYPNPPHKAPFGGKSTSSNHFAQRKAEGASSSTERPAQSNWRTRAMARFWLSCTPAAAAA